ncbi:MAG: gliding motility-associated C-terminal domain-containing protein [Bacteroidetes bacterium]|nr:gliding motility-associated C-terminal domain-containing protein [Bacteroidota bacterium]
MSLFLAFLLLAFAGKAQVNLSNGLVAYYPFNGTFNDASGNGNNGTAMNGTTFGTDQWGNANNAASFDGFDDWVDIGVPSFNFSHKFSFAFRFQTLATRCQTIMARADLYSVPNNAQFQVAFNAPAFTLSGMLLGTNHQGNCLMASSGNFTHYTTTNSLINANQWYCVVMTFDSGVKSIYLNGLLAARTTVSGTASNTLVDSCTAGTLRLGQWWNNDPLFFKGLLDELRLYNRVLNQQEIDSLCNLKGSSGITINQYAAVTQRSLNCDNAFMVDDGRSFHAGDTVLMIQMKGATIDTSNSASFGDVLNLNGAGNYEFNTIKSVSGNMITLFYQVKKAYDIPRGLVQFVRVPNFSSYSVNSKHTCMPWNGTKGGVFAINVAGTLTLNDDIDVSGNGFEGGLSNPYYRGGNYRCNETGYYHRPNFDTSAQKGEGITTVGIDKSYGRGKLANGGGGGNTHNSGGGGGSNAGAGGLGGQEYGECSGSTGTNIYGGLGGLAVSTSSRAFLGGGGGAGHVNEQTISNGGSGGGIILINAGSLSGNGYRIAADGGNAPECNGPGTNCIDDGTGGGGGGGTILINALTYSNPNLSSKGGKGADLYQNALSLSLHFYHGPGGGGGGGLVSVNSGISGSLSSANVSGGANGIIPQAAGIAHGAMPGSQGQTISTLVFVSPTDTFKAGTTMTLDFSYQSVSCNTVQFTALPAGYRYSSYQWDFPGGSSSSQASPTFSFPGAGTYQVSLRVIDANGCILTITKDVVVTPFKGKRKDTTICLGQSVQLHTYDSAVSYSWSPALGLSSTTIFNPIASPSSTTMYVVAVDAGPGCSFSDTFVVNVVPAVKANFDYTPRPPIANTLFQFYNLSSGATTYAWSFGDAATSTEKDPKHLYLKSGTFQVCLVASNGSCKDTICKMLDADVHLVIAVPSAFSPNGDGANDVLYVRGSGVESFSLKVFNRWGQLVFETKDLAKGWDGSFKGQPQEEDTYAYVLQAHFIDGSHYQKTGNLSLIR